MKYYVQFIWNAGYLYDLVNNLTKQWSDDMDGFVEVSEAQ